MAVMLEIEFCVQCPYCHIVDDPDPFDWFCDDDQALICGKSEKELITTRTGNYMSGEPCIACGDRPYEIHKETPPDWCPLKKQKPNDLFDFLVENT